jgi:hypothetical protein
MAKVVEIAHRIHYGLIDPPIVGAAEQIDALFGQIFHRIDLAYCGEADGGPARSGRERDTLRASGNATGIHIGAIVRAARHDTDSERAARKGDLYWTAMNAPEDKPEIEVRAGSACDAGSLSAASAAAGQSSIDQTNKSWISQDALMVDLLL